MLAAIDRKECVHCGTSFRPTPQRPTYCCAGCQYVHGLILARGLGQFYDLQSGIPPVKPVVFETRDNAWVQPLFAATEQAGQTTLILDLQGISCLGCVWLIEQLFRKKPGALRIRVEPALGTMELHWQAGLFDGAEFVAELQRFGYLAGPPGNGAAGDQSKPWCGLTIRLGVCAALAMNTMLFTLPFYLGMERDAEFADTFRMASLVLGTLSFVIGGTWFIGRAWRTLSRGVIHMDLPIALGLIMAWLGSVYASAVGAHGFLYLDFVSVFTFLMLGGRWLQQKAVESNRRRLLSTPLQAGRVQLMDGSEIDATSLVAGQKYLVRPGQVVPVRSTLRSEGTMVGLEWISGESEPAHLTRGDTVASGAVHRGAELVELESREAWVESLLCRLFETKPRGDTRNVGLERFIGNYMICVLVLGALGFIGWWMAGAGVVAALQVLVSVLVVSCPCASGVALPVLEELSVSRLRHAGVFIRESSIWHRLVQIRKVVFDKTGTLTLENLVLRNPIALFQLAPEQQQILLSMVRSNAHPASMAIREELLAAGVSAMKEKERGFSNPQKEGGHSYPPSSAKNGGKNAPAPLQLFGQKYPPETSATDVQPPREVIGMGLELAHAGHTWRLGRAGWAATGSNGDGDCVFSRDGEPLAALSFGEEPRPDAAAELQALKARGLEVHVLSGDRTEKVRALALRLDLPPEDCLGDLTPDDKAEAMRKLNAADTLYLGDGANDTLAFQAAHCTGTPAAERGLLEHHADFYYLGRGLNGVRALLETTEVRRKTQRRVLAFAICYNLGAVALSLAGQMNPLLAAVAMPASSLISVAIVLTGARRRK